jgi:hypothetical protein
MEPYDHKKTVIDLDAVQVQGDGSLAVPSSPAEPSEVIHEIKEHLAETVSERGLKSFLGNFWESIVNAWTDLKVSIKESIGP